MIRPGWAAKVSQMLGPLPSSSAAPSIWYADVLVPNRKPGGSCGKGTRTILQVRVEIRRGSTRFVEREQGRLTRHSFSFGADYDPARLEFGPMVCHDDHLLGPGRGFDTHRHSGLEIVTYVVSGALRHTDSTGSTIGGAGGLGRRAVDR